MGQVTAIALKKTNNYVDQEVVEALEAMLSKARRGDLVSWMAVTETVSGLQQTARAGRFADEANAVKVLRRAATVLEEKYADERMISPPTPTAAKLSLRRGWVYGACATLTVLSLPTVESYAMHFYPLIALAI